ncbi:hypothetical protein OY671_011430, partial [Metschnikowia pulcherrima]
AEAGQRRITLEGLDDAPQPVRSRRRIVVGDRDDASPRLLQPPVQRRHSPGGLHDDPAQRQAGRRSFKHPQGFGVLGAMDDQNLIRRPRSVGERVQAPAQVGGPSPRRHDHRDGQAHEACSPTRAEIRRARPPNSRTAAHPIDAATTTSAATAVQAAPVAPYR